MTSLRFVALVVVLTLHSLPAEAFSLTGKWQGTFVCKWHYVDGTTGTAKSGPRFLDIIHDTNLDLVVVDQDGDHDYDYTGFVVRNGKKPEAKGQLAIASCSTSANIAATAPAEIGNLSVSVKIDRGALKGTSILTFPAPNWEVDQCKWTFRLVSRIVPIYNTYCGT